MYSRVKKVFIGTDIARTASAVVFGGSVTAQAAAAGEIFVLDKNKKIMDAGKTVSDSDTIFIAEVTGTTITYANEAGTSVSALKVLISDPIVGNLVRGYSKKSYLAPAEQVTTIYYMNQTVTVGDEYVLRIVYKDVKEHPGQKTQTYRVIATSSTIGKVFNQIAKQISSDVNARVTVTSSGGDITNFGTTDNMILTGKVIPECTTALTDIDEYRQVVFETFFYYIPHATVHVGLGPFNIVTLSTAMAITTALRAPQGAWYQVRDAEKSVLGTQFGVTNRIWFPVKQPAFRTVVGKTYNEILIDSDLRFKSPDNGYDKVTKLITQIFIVVPATTNQTSNVLAVLNPWMASTVAAFNGLSF